MHFTLGFSPCPNDTFIFDALVNQKINIKPFTFDVVLADVQQLNEWALEEKLDFTKVSYGVYPLIQQNYSLLSSGGALGKGVGPLLISKKPIPENISFKNLQALVEQSSIALPGKHTTAHFLFNYAFPKAQNKQHYIFHEIENIVLHNQTDFGVIIHENRFTFQDKGLFEWIDLGHFWEQQTQLPIPLGGIVAKKNISSSIVLQVNQLIQKSIDYSFQHYPFISEYVKEHAQEMSESVMRKHIDLYVNHYSMDLGSDGQKAVEMLLECYR